MSKNIFSKSTLEYYNYGEYNRMEPIAGPSYKVKVSDKDGNIITIENDGGLYAMVSLSFDNNDGILRLIDVAHDNSVLAEIEMPNADYIYNCRYDENKNAILFDVKALYGDKTDTIELNVDDLVELYEAGQGIEIGEKSQETGRKPISVKLAEGESLLTLTDDGLGIDDKVVTEDELEAAISGKADQEYVDEMFHEFSGITEEIDHIKEILGTDEEDPSLQEQIETNRDDIAELDDEVGELSGNVATLSGDVDTLEEKVDTISGDVDTLEEKVDTIEGNLDDVSGKVDTISGDVETISGDVDTLEEKVDTISGDVDTLEEEVEANKVKIELVTSGLDENVREEYILTNTSGTQLGETIKIYKDSALKDAEFVTVDDTGKEGQFLKLTYILSNGTEKVVYIDLSILVAESEFGDGLEVVNGIVKAKINPASDGFISVSENGILLTGIASFLSSLVETDTQQWTAINTNRQDLELVDRQLWDAINTERTDRMNADTTLQSNIDVEAGERQAEDERINTALSAETRDRISGDTRLEDLINTERDRAMAAEDQERRRALAAEGELDTRITNETTEREREDADIRQDVADKYRNLNLRIDGVVTDLGAEARTREETDNALRDDIDDIKERYATIEYVDEEDAAHEQAAITTSVNSAKTYTDGEIDTLERELKEYCDSGHTELQRAISENTTRINEISNENQNGVLDVLHREFHALIDGITSQQLSGLLLDMLRRIEALEENPPSPGPGQPSEASDVNMTGYPVHEGGVVRPDMSVLSAISALEGAVIDNETSTLSALNDLEANKLDASAYTPTDLSNYYTKDETSGATEISDALADKQDVSGMSAYTTSEGLDDKLGSAFTGENSAVTVTEVIEEDEIVTSAALNDLNTRKLDASAYTPTDLSDYYMKSETSGATEISTALDSKQDFSGMSAYTTSESIEEKLGSAFTGENSGKTVTEVIEENEEVTSAALNDLNTRIGN